MQYLLMDLHQRYIGTLTYKQPLSVGDVFQAYNSKTYTVVSIDVSRNPNQSAKSLTVIPHKTVAHSTH